MNKHDKEILRQNWELKKAQLAGSKYQQSMDISSSCYVVFGTYGISVFKYRNGVWYRKIVGDWKSLTFDEFMEQFRQEAWESTGSLELLRTRPAHVKMQAAKDA